MNYIKTANISILREPYKDCKYCAKHIKTANIISILCELYKECKYISILREPYKKCEYIYNLQL